MTSVVQIIIDYPELNIPDLEHYQPRQTWTLETSDSLHLLSFTGHNYDISLYGLNTFQMLEFRYVQYASYVSCAYTNDENKNQIYDINIRRKI